MLSEKAVVVGLGQAPILAKLVKNITNGKFVQLADSLSANLSQSGAPHISGRQASGLKNVVAGQRRRHPHLDGGLHHLSNGDVYLPSPPLARLNEIQVSDYPNSLRITRSGLAQDIQYRHCMIVPLSVLSNVSVIPNLCTVPFTSLCMPISKSIITIYPLLSSQLSEHKPSSQSAGNPTCACQLFYTNAQESCFP